ncbi:hypothetical protein E4U27_003979 [Claviceps purpurea]|nr:hypothetical protein E4U27_003979 [Claviceps purpurea]
MCSPFSEASAAYKYRWRPHLTFKMPFLTLKPLPNFEVAELEARHEDLGKAEVLDKRARLFQKTITVQGTNRPVNPPPVYVDEVRLDFIMAKRQAKAGNRMVPQWYCKSLRFTNGGAVRRRVIARVHGGPTMMMAFLPSRASKVLAVPKNVSEFIMEVISVPGKGRGQ